MNMSIKCFLFVSAVFCSLMASACHTSAAETKSNGIPLTYAPQHAKALSAQSPDESWIRAKSVTYWETAGQKQATVHLYLDNSQKSIEDADVYAYLEQDGTWYEIGLVGSYGLEDVNIHAVDRTSDGLSEIEITGGLGAAYMQMTLLRYSPEKQEWLQVLQMGSPEYADLDGDGSQELIAVSRGSLPPYVYVYRWNGNQFEMADIAQSAGMDYAMLLQQDGVYTIETGKWENNEHQDRRIFSFKSGNLVESSE